MRYTDSEKFLPLLFNLYWNQNPEKLIEDSIKQKFSPSG